MNRAPQETAEGVVQELVGIGAGPFNLGLAALSAPLEELSALFLERAESFEWHPGMMLDGVHLQVPFLADLVSMADPTSPYSFLNYLKEKGRLYRFYIREDFKVLRREYNAYCAWVAGQLPSVRFSHGVVAAEYRDGLYRLTVEGPGGRYEVLARRLVLGTGTAPSVPACALPLLGREDVLHSADYLSRRPELLGRERIAVIGSGQSAAEVFRDLLASAEPDRELVWVTRSERFFPLEYTKLTLEMTSPEYVDYFHALHQDAKDRLGRTHRSLFKGIDADLVDEIFELLYAREIDGAMPARLHTNVELEEIGDAGDRLSLRLREAEQDEVFEIETDAVVLGTGYAYQEPDFLAGLAERIRRLPDGRLAVSRDYEVGVEPGEIFVQNAELHSHGFSAPDLGMGAYRNSVILRTVLGGDDGRGPYNVERRIAFQEFGAPGRDSDAERVQATTAGASR